METLSELLILYEHWSPHKSPVMWNFNVFFMNIIVNESNKRLSCLRSETQITLIWRHCIEYIAQLTLPLVFLCFSLNHILNKQSNARHQSIIIHHYYMLLNVFLIGNRIYCDKCRTIIINAHALLSMNQLLWYKKKYWYHWKFNPRSEFLRCGKIIKSDNTKREWITMVGRRLFALVDFWEGN